MPKFDLSFIEALKSDDERAYEKLRLFAYKRAFDYLKTHEDADDVASDALMSIRDSIKKYRPSKGRGSVESNFKAWVKKIIFNAYLDLREARKREASFEMLACALDLGDDGGKATEGDYKGVDAMLSMEVYEAYPFKHNPQWALAAAEVIESTKKLKNPKKRLAFLLMYLCGFTEREISELMKENFHSIQTVIQRARKEMKVICEKQGIDVSYLSPESWRIKNFIH